MKYKLPKDIAHDFNVSQKTVYNYLTKYGDKISTKKEYGKTFVSVNDFQSVLQKVYTTVPSELDDATKKEGSELV
jgi:transposase